MAASQQQQSPLGIIFQTIKQAQELDGAKNELVRNLVNSIGLIMAFNPPGGSPEIPLSCALHISVPAATDTDTEFLLVYIITVKDL